MREFLYYLLREIDFAGCDGRYSAPCERSRSLSSIPLSASKKDNMIIVRNGENATAFCVVTNGKVAGYDDRRKFDVSGVEWNDTSKVYAIPIQTAEPYKLIYAAGRS